MDRLASAGADSSTLPRVTTVVTPEQRRIQQALWASMPPPDFVVEIQLNVEGNAAELARLAYDWVDQLTMVLAPDARAGGVDLPVVEGTALKRMRPGDEYVTARVTRLSLSRGKTRVLSANGMAWLRAELLSVPAEVYVTFHRVGTDGRPMLGPATLRIQPVEWSPGWLQLCGHLRESAFSDPATQQTWLTALYSFADQANPGYGQIGYYRDAGETAIEVTTDPHVPGFVNTSRDSGHTIGRSRETLRGHDWLTIVPGELAVSLGGAPGLAATGAFAEVRALSRGGVALLATPAFTDYDTAAAERPFRALAPVLPPGRPLLLERSPAMPPSFVVDQARDHD
jgi:hypothetical protein